MKIENQLTNLDLSKELEKLGVPQKSIWMWVKYELWKEPRIELSDLVSEIKMTCLSGKREYAYSAFSCAEIGEMLPVTIEMKNETHWFDCNKTVYWHRCGYIWIHEGSSGWGQLDNSQTDHSHSVGRAKTEADCRAKMLIYLLKNELVDP